MVLIQLHNWTRHRIFSPSLDAEAVLLIDKFVFALADQTILPVFIPNFELKREESNHIFDISFTEYRKT